MTSVDQRSGKLTLRGPEGDINVRFPPMALQNVKNGDTVTVAVGLMEQNAPPASPRMPSGQGSRGNDRTNHPTAPSAPGASSPSEPPSAAAK